MRKAAILSLVIAMLFIAACKGSGEPVVYGKWQVSRVERGGDIMEGGSFKGSRYEFRKDGTVQATNERGDTVTSGFEHAGDSLIYTMQGQREVYVIDSLDDKNLWITAQVDGLETRIRMVKIDK